MKQPYIIDEVSINTICQITRKLLVDFSADFGKIFEF